jgi:hypothetical protein
MLNCSFLKLKKLLIIFGLFFPMLAIAQTVELWIEGGTTENGNTCVVTASAKNATRATISFRNKLNFYDRSSHLISSEMIQILNVRPGNTSSSQIYVQNAKCQEVGKVAFRGQEMCMVNGNYLDNCPFTITFPRGRGVMDIVN